MACKARLSWNLPETTFVIKFSQSKETIINQSFGTSSTLFWKNISCCRIQNKSWWSLLVFSLTVLNCLFPTFFWASTLRLCLIWSDLPLELDIVEVLELNDDVDVLDCLPELLRLLIVDIDDPVELRLVELIVESGLMLTSETDFV